MQGLPYANGRGVDVFLERLPLLGHVGDGIGHVLTARHEVAVVVAAPPLSTEPAQRLKERADVVAALLVLVATQVDEISEIAAAHLNLVRIDAGVELLRDGRAMLERDLIQPVGASNAFNRHDAHPPTTLYTRPCTNIPPRCRLAHAS